MVKIQMPMPTCCAKCGLCQDGKYCRARDIMFGEEDTSWIYESKPNWCPLIEDSPVAPKYLVAGIFCGKCGSYIRTCDTFCSSCGRKIQWAENRRTGE